MIRFTNRQGISLVEVVVAMTLLAVVLTSLAGATYNAARRASGIAGDGYRQAMMMQEMNRMTALPWASLPGAAGCTTVAGGTFPHTRCITVTNTAQNIRRVQVIVTPAQPGVRPDTTIFDRTNPPVGNPLSF
jgi:type II secretory pathway component PulJ